MFALIWPDPTLDALADIYLAATPAERAWMAAAVDGLNARLRSDPLNEGESRSGGFRLVFIPLLTVLFHVTTADNIVRVVRVRRFGT